MDNDINVSNAWGGGKVTNFVNPAILATNLSCTLFILSNTRLQFSSKFTYRKYVHKQKIFMIK